MEWNKTQADYPDHLCIHQLFEAQVARTPDAIAFMAPASPLESSSVGPAQLTYRELNRRANQLGRYLQRWGVGPEVLVGIWVERSLEMVIGLLGILKAGGAYVPLDPAYPKERLAFMLADSQAAILVTHQQLAKEFPATTARVVLLDVDEALIAQEDDENLVSHVVADQPAYVIYTSGSTGTPKGVVGLHRGAVNRFAWMWQTYPFAAGEVGCQKTALSFLDSLWEIFGPLLQGTPTVIIPDEIAKDPPRLVETLADYQVTRIVLVPSLLRALLSLTDLQQRLPRLKYWVTSGEALSLELFQQFQAICPTARLLNLYGSSEVSADATWYDSSQTELLSAVPIGRPIANMEAYILDAQLQPVPVGVEGELYIGGVGLARGYFNRPELTAEKFIPHPFSPEPGARLYKPGDLARYRPDGHIEYLGRLDHQVKIRGFRVELGEIEAILWQHPAVRDVVVMARQDAMGATGPAGIPRLVAYVVANRAQEPTVSELHRFLKERLPDYMIPAAFVLLEALPLTPSGKVYRLALPAPDMTRPELDEAFVAPRSPLEAQLAEIWAQVLGVAQVGVHDDFFELGGDSILTFQIVAKANQAGLWLTPKQLFEHPTIAELAALVSPAPATSAPQGPVTGITPLTPIQHWFFERDLAEPHHWNMSMLLTVPPPFTPSLLEQALQHLFVHHDALRLRFEQTELGWQQSHAGPEEALAFSQVDLSALPEAEQWLAISRLAAQLQASLNLSAGPLIRATGFDLGPTRRGRLFLAVHHLVIDGVSWRILLEDLQTVYAQLCQGKAVRLPSKTTSFKQWAERSSQYAQSSALQQEAAYWLTEHRAPAPSLPVDYPQGRSANVEASAQSVFISLGIEETRVLLQEVPAAYRTQINDVLLTAVAMAFRQWTGQSTLLLDLEGHGREEIIEGVDLSRTVGWFTSKFPVRLDLGQATHPGEALKTIKEQLRRIPNRGIGYGLLRYLYQDRELAAVDSISQQLRALPQAEVVFNYLGQFDQVFSEPLGSRELEPDSLTNSKLKLKTGSPMFKLASEASEPNYSPRGSRSHLLEIEGSVVEGCLQVDWVYSGQIYRQATIEALAENFLEALQTLMAHCQSTQIAHYTPSDFPEAGLSQAELDDLMLELGEYVE